MPRYATFFLFTLSLSSGHYILQSQQAAACDLSDATCRAIELAGSSPKLMKEIQSELKASESKLSEIRCGGLRLGRIFVHLGGARILPYDCTVGTAKLEILGQADIYDDEGNEGATPDTAMYLFQHSPSWGWTK